MKNYSHYYKSVKHLTHIDVYRVLDLFKVERASVAHAVKKLLCAGNRGAKNYVQDITEARDSLNRELEMLTEDEPTVSLKPVDSGSHWRNHSAVPPCPPLIQSADPHIAFKLDAGVFSREALLAVGWTDELIAEHGIKVADGLMLPAPLKPTVNDEIENFLRKQGMSDKLPPSPKTAYDVYIHISQSQPMAALYGRVVATLPPHRAVTVTYPDIFNYLFCLLSFYVRGRKTLFTKDELFSHHFEIKDGKLQVFDDFLAITQHAKFDFDAFAGDGTLIPK